MPERRAARVLLRADATAAIGLGHVMRSIALGQAADAPVHLAASAPSEALRRQLAGAGVVLHEVAGAAGSAADAAATADCARSLGAGWVIVDGYAFGDEYEARVRDAGLAVLAFDDHRHAAHVADVVLDQNQRCPRPSTLAASTRFLSGPRYVCLRREFRRRQANAIPSSRRRGTRVLVTMGGTDPGNVTPRILDGLRRLDVAEITVVSSRLAAHRGAEGGSDGTRYRFIESPPDMSAVMAEADLAVAGAGATTWELAFMGVPALLVVVAENQQPVARTAVVAGMAECLGVADGVTAGVVATAVRSLMEDPERRRSMAERGRALVDGFGPERVCEAMESRDLVIRPLEPDDAATLLQWANEPAVRAVSFSPEPISPTTHARWMAAKMASAHSHCFVALATDDTPIGQVRFDLADDATAEISVSLSATQRGRGLGARLIRVGLDELYRTTETKRVRALIKPDNAASIRAFERAGFAFAERTTVRGQAAVQYLHVR